MWTRAFVLCVVCLFEVFVEPAEELAVPYHRVLGFEHLVSLVFERNQTRRNTHQLCGGEGLKTLGVGYAIVLLAGENQNGGVPILHEFVWRVGIGTLRGGVGFVPISTFVVVVDEPQLLGVAVHALEIEDSAVSNQCFETFLVVARQEEGRVAAVACTHATQTLLIRPGFGRYVVDGSQQVADVLTRLVARNLVQPLLTERRQTATVGGNNDIALGSHKLEVPTVAPELAYHALGTSLTVE